MSQGTPRSVNRGHLTSVFSGQVTSALTISKEGNRLLRWALVVAATQAARRPGPLRAWFRALQQRKGMKIARVALARRLAEMVYQIWKQEIDFVTLVRGGVRG